MNKNVGLLLLSAFILVMPVALISVVTNTEVANSSTNTLSQHEEPLEEVRAGGYRTSPVRTVPENNIGDDVSCSSEWSYLIEQQRDSCPRCEAEDARRKVEVDREVQPVEAQRLKAEKNRQMLANAQAERDRIARETVLAMRRKFEMNNEELDNIRSFKIESRKQIFDARAERKLEIKQQVKADAERSSKIEKSIETRRFEMEAEIARIVAETGRE